MHIRDLTGDGGIGISMYRSGDTPYDYRSPISLAAGDLTGDSMDDLVIGIGDVPQTELGYQGIVFVLKGDAAFATNFSGESADLAAINSSSTTGHQFVGAQPYGNAGTSVAIGRVRGQESGADLIIGATGYAYESGNYEGAAFVLYGDRLGNVGATENEFQALGMTYLYGEVSGPHNGFLLYNRDTLSYYSGASSTATLFFNLGLGQSVAVANLDGDGFDDILIGGPETTRRVGYYSDSYFGLPRVEIAFGDATTWDGGAAHAFDNTKVSSLEYGLYGRFGYSDDTVPTESDPPTGADSYLGYTVRAIGDINGDGKPDVAVTAPGVTTDYNHYGVVYVVFGSDSRNAFKAGVNGLSPSGLNGTNGFVIRNGDTQNTGSRFSSVIASGDVNGDGLTDLIVAQQERVYNGETYESLPGRVVVIFGNNTENAPWLQGAGVVDLDSLGDGQKAEITLMTGSYSYSTNDDQEVDSLLAADVNGDGIQDVLIGSSGIVIRRQVFQGESYNNYYYYTGAVFVVFGKNDWGSTPVDLATLAAPNGATVFGPDRSDLGPGYSGNIGGSLAVGDLNGDGLPDIIAGGLDGYMDVAGEVIYFRKRSHVFVVFGQNPASAPTIPSFNVNGEVLPRFSD